MQALDYLEFGKAFSSLGTSLEQQVEDLLVQGSSAELNGNAVDLIEERLVSALEQLDSQAGQDLQDAIDEWRAEQARVAEEVA
jgi:hypothetical protein